MNLSEHFEPIEARDEALNTVHRRARRRAIKHKISMGGGLAVTLLVVFIVPTLATGYFFNVGSSEQQATSTPSADSGASTGTAAPTYLPNSDFIAPEAQPSGLYLFSPWLLLLGLAVVVITTAMSLFQSGTVTRFSRRERIQLMIGALFVLFGLITRFMH